MVNVTVCIVFIRIDLVFVVCGEIVTIEELKVEGWNYYGVFGESEIVILLLWDSELNWET